MEARRKVIPNRKFHDAWALFAYIAYSCALNYTVFMLNEKFAFKDLFNLNSIFQGTILVIIVLILALILFLTIPAIVMHFSCIVAPFISIALTIYFGNPFGIFISILANCFYILYYFLIIKKHIKYAAVVIKDSSKIITKHIIVIILTIFISSVLFLSQTLFLTSKIVFQNQMHIVLLGAIVLQFYWTSFAIFYFFRVFVASLVAEEVFTYDTGINMALNAIKNTLIASGTVFMGSFLIALVSTLRFLVRYFDQRNSRNRNLVIHILFVILSVLISILEDIINMINEFTYVYVAIYGQSYVKSINETYELVRKNSANTLVNICCLNPVLFIYSVVSFIPYFTIFIMNDPLQKLSEMDQKKLFSFCLSLTSNSMVVYLALTTFSSAMLAITYSYIENKQAIREKYPKTAAALEEQASLSK